jgi:PAS domain S-box-containing protein
MTRILVVDDEAAITTQLEERLNRMGYQVAGTAASGEEAIARAREIRPDIILMDIVMPGRIDGVEAALIIRREMEIPVVFLTAYGDDEYIERSKAAEPLGFLVKPFQLNTLKATMEIALHNRMLTRNLRVSEAGWRRLMEATGEAIILCDPEGKIHFWNSGAEKIFGHSPEEAAGLTFLSLLSEGTPHEVRDWAACFPPPDDPPRPEWREAIGLRKDWSRFPMEFCVSRLWVGDVASQIFVARDISARKRREKLRISTLEERERELTGIRKQVENHLRLIYDLLNLQGEYFREREPREGPAGREVGSERLIDLLDRLSPPAAGASIDFPAYVRNLTGRLLRAHRIDPGRISMNMRMDEARLKLRTAISWGIILSELLANALIHAFPEGRPGRVEIEFRAVHPDRFRLTVADDGVGLPAGFEPGGPDSRGLKIVEKLINRCGGAWQMDRRDGTCIRVLLPAS